METEINYSQIYYHPSKNLAHILGTWLDQVILSAIYNLILLSGDATETVLTQSLISRTLLGDGGGSGGVCGGR